MKKTVLIAAVFILPFHVFAGAEEGMWLPHLLKQLNEGDMKTKGMKLSADDIYNINKSCIKDAILSFGGFCTGSVISAEGLVLTNHHCGFGQIQAHSSVEKDYITNGFWAKTQAEELKNQGLTATFIVRIEDVTEKVLKDVTPEMSETDRDKKISDAISKIQKESKEGTHYNALIRPFFNGNEYYLFITETFRDVRLVGAPPQSIGTFGGDTDNWMWPRHTGDFSLFRIYAGPDNKPADYAPENKPYQPKYHLNVSLKGLKKDDFTFIFGFPGRTNEYLPSQAVNITYSISNPSKVKIREAKLAIWETAMAANDAVRIKYAAKRASISNYHKKWIGENRGIKSTNALERKKELENQFTAWMNASGDRSKKYGSLLPSFEKVYSELGPLSKIRDYYNESLTGIELLRYASSFRNLVSISTSEKISEEEIKKAVERLKKDATAFFKDYDAATDQKIFAALLGLYTQDIDKQWHPEFYVSVNKKYKGNLEKYAADVFKKSIFTSEEKVAKFLAAYSASASGKITKDPAYQLISSFSKMYSEKVTPALSQLSDEAARLNRMYVQGLREMMPAKKFYPDANGTLRVAYGKIDEYDPADGVHYTWYTTLDGIMAKMDNKNPDFTVPSKLAELHKKQDYGQYADNGVMKVCFLASNHSTGGNSGSPVLNANGELIGLNFDTNWEGTMSDIIYDASLSRNISVDIRYVMFIIDKFAGADRLIHEITMVKEAETATPTGK